VERQRGGPETWSVKHKSLRRNEGKGREKEIQKREKKKQTNEEKRDDFARPQQGKRQFRGNFKRTGKPGGRLESNKR